MEPVKQIRRLPKRNCNSLIVEAIPVKDLRTRRVFSRAPTRSATSIDGGREKIQKGEEIDDGFIGNFVTDSKCLSHSEDQVKQLQGNNSSKKMVANSRATKVFIAPGSFRYKRLLSCLKDMKPDQRSALDVDAEPVYGESLSNNEHVNGDVEQLKVSNSSDRTVSNKCPRKVFKAPGSFSYRRLLPFLEDAKRDLNAPSEIEIVNAKSPSKVKNLKFESCDQDSSNVALNEQYVTENFTGVRCKASSGSPDDQKTVYAESHKLDVQPITEQVISGVVNNDVDPVFGLMNYENFKDYFDGPSRGDDLMEQCVQSTPGQDFQLVVNNQMDASFGDDILNNGNSKNYLNSTTGVDDSREEYVQAIIEQVLSGVVDKDSDSELGDRVLKNGSVRKDGDGLIGVNDLLNNGSVRNDGVDGLTGVNDLLNNGSIGNDRDCLPGVNDLQEENVQMTPPDSVIYSTPNMEGCTENIESNCCVTKSILPCHNPDDIICTTGVGNLNTFSFSPNQINVIPPKVGMVLNPCSRRRVFKRSGSFSYRRLLPYLTSVATTNTCDAMICDPETPNMELGGEQHPRLLDSSIEGSSMNHLNPESSPNMQGTGENKHNQAVASVLIPTPNVSLLKSSCGSNFTAQVLSSVTSTNVNGHLNALDMQNEEPLQTVNAEPNFLPKLDFDHSLGKIDSCLHAEFICSNINQNILVAESNMEVSPNELEECAQDSTHVDNKQLGGTIVAKESPSIELFLNPRNHVNYPERGILKRNPRGCRGRCDCLHCASFRLHAERSFCFSRNQLQDAEEVALDLVKELSSLRHMLEDSSTADTTDPTVINLNQLQVKEACRKALEAEKLAKERLNEMNEDLNHHCKAKNLSRPRVTFLGEKQRN